MVAHDAWWQRARLDALLSDAAEDQPAVLMERYEGGA
jgi:hypothetical protein